MFTFIKIFRTGVLKVNRGSSIFSRIFAFICYVIGSFMLAMTVFALSVLIMVLSGASYEFMNNTALGVFLMYFLGDTIFLIYVIKPEIFKMPKISIRRKSAKDKKIEDAFRM